MDESGDISPSWLSDDVVQLTLPADATAAGSARRFVVETWPNLADDVLDDLRLVVTELVSNAQRHGRPEFEVRMRVQPFAIDLAVLDHGDGRPTPRQPAHDADSGRGLQIVSALADRWGVEPLGGEPGKFVWATLRTSG